VNQKALIFLLASVVLIVPATAFYVSEVDYIDTDSDFYGNDHVLIGLVVDGTDEQVHAEISSDNLSGLSEYNTSQNVSINAELTDVYANYEVEDRNLRTLRPIEYVRTKHTTESSAKLWAKNNCLDLDKDGSANYNTYQRGLINPWGEWIVNCATQDMEQSSFNTGFLQSPPDILFESEWHIDVEGRPKETITLSNSGSRNGSVERINNTIQVEFVTLQNTGSNAPNPQNTLAAFSSTNGWRLIEKDRFDNYIEYIETEAPENVETMREKDSYDIKIWKEENNEYARNNFLKASQEYESSSIYGSEVSDGESEFHNGVFQFRPSQDFEWFAPEFNIRVKGEFLGLQKQFGDLEILRVENAEVTGISGGLAEVEIKNNGVGRSAFDISTDCAKFETAGISSRASLGPGEAKTIFLTLDADGSEEFKEDCNILVKDIETAEIFESPFYAKYTPQEECVAESQFVRVEDGQETIYECAEDGVSVFEIETCEQDERAKHKNHGYECREINSLNEIQQPEDCKLALLPRSITNLLENDFLITDPICSLENRLNNITQRVDSLINTLTVFALMLGSIMAALAAFRLAKIL